MEVDVKYWVKVVGSVVVMSVDCVYWEDSLVSKVGKRLIRDSLKCIVK